jgi:hypothetical protein
LDVIPEKAEQTPSIEGGTIQFFPGPRVTAKARSGQLGNVFSIDLSLGWKIEATSDQFLRGIRSEAL